MGECFLCWNELTKQNKSIEHILPNSIGGRLKSQYVLCEECNRICGQLFDNELAKIGVIFSSKLNLSLDRGKVPNLIGTNTNTGEKLLVKPNWDVGHLEPKFTYEDQKVFISAAKKKRVLQEAERIKKKQRSQGLGVPNIGKPKMSIKSNKNKISIKQSVNQTLLFRSVAKIICGYYYHLTGNLTNIKGISRFIRYGDTNNYVWLLNLTLNKHFFYNEPNHLITICGLKREKILYGYFEMFASIGFICVLNTNYQGDDYNASYIYNPKRNEEKKWHVDLQLHREDIMNIIRIKPYSQEIDIVKH